MVPKMQSATLCVLGAGTSFPISLRAQCASRCCLRFPFVGRAHLGSSALAAAVARLQRVKQMDGPWSMVTGRPAVGEKMHKRLVALPSRQPRSTGMSTGEAAAAKWSASRVEGRTGGAARGTPGVTTSRKVRAREPQPRTLQRVSRTTTPHTAKHIAVESVP